MIVENSLEIEAGKELQYQVIRIKEGGVLSVAGWDGKKGGLLLLKCDLLQIEKGGKIDLTGKGFRGGASGAKTHNDTAFQGESELGVGTKSTTSNGSGGGGGISSGGYGSVGGGGGGCDTQGKLTRN